MDTEQVWNEIKNMKGLVLRTLDRHNPFEIIAFTESTVIIIPKSTGKECPLCGECLPSSQSYWPAHAGRTGK
ncbi:MAG: hypothetical protein NTW69_13690 [Chloroflexi bacterium]|nr:hypothetical protein [Chloroflexota bacterium]